MSAHNFIDLTGQRFGRLTVIERAENSKDRKARWLCQCDCGNTSIVIGKDLRNGKTKSCGCFAKEITSETCLKDLTGMKFGRLTVISRAENSKAGQTRWLCKCDCGNEIIVQGGHLKSGVTKSCGCIVTKHGMFGTPIYSTWNHIKERCFNPNHTAYHNYGGRGITMFTEWIDNFQAFYDYVSKLEHYGEDGYTIDRIDNNKGYEPDNLRWADIKTQQRNRRNTVYVKFGDDWITLGEASEITGINYQTLWDRLKRGITGEDLYKKPVKE